MKLNTPTTRNSTSARHGFTLIELMVVIVIIGILMALILPALASVRRNVQLAAVSTEMTQLDQAVASFKAKFGKEPPSNLTIPTSEAAWGNADRQKVLGIWEQFDFSTCGGLTGGYPASPVFLNGAECLTFFLGGMNSGTPGSPTLIGFSKNPATPWSVAGENRDVPFFDGFKSNRLVDVDGDGVVEFLDSLPDQKTPMLYISGQGKNYRKANVADAFDDYDVYDNVADSAVNSMDLVNCYLEGDAKTPQRAQGYQIISPGFDGLYGVGGVYKDGSELTGVRQPEADNITNFSGGVLQK